MKNKGIRMELYNDIVKQMDNILIRRQKNIKIQQHDSNNKRQKQD